MSTGIYVGVLNTHTYTHTCRHAHKHTNAHTPHTPHTCTHTNATHTCAHDTHTHTHMHERIQTNTAHKHALHPVVPPLQPSPDLHENVFVLLLQDNVTDQHLH